MSDPSWDQISAAIEQAREPAPWNGWDCCLFCGFGREDVGDHLTTCWWAECNAHLDTLAAIHQLAIKLQDWEYGHAATGPLAEVVIDALARMGALETDNDS